MLTKRIIPRIEFKGNNLIKGLEFEGNRCLGVLSHFCEQYSINEKSDEIFFYDIVASLYNQEFNFKYVNKLCDNINVPITFCGGINCLDNIYSCLSNGADKVSINTSLFEKKELLNQAVSIFGAPTIISNIEYYFDDHKYLLLSEFGRTKVDYDIFDWVKYLEDSGVGEIHFLDVGRDGLGNGIDIDFINKITKNLKIPFIVGCGFGSKYDVLRVFNETTASGVSVASMFHYFYKKKINKDFASYEGPELRLGKDIDSGNIDFLNFGYGGFEDIFVEPTSISDLKSFLFENNIQVRLN
tara:strand:- start:5446 stop:6339 length:894 start_codon:yes stop_codon:yes gene_type:complete